MHFFKSSLLLTRIEYQIQNWVPECETFWRFFLRKLKAFGHSGIRVFGKNWGSPLRNFYGIRVFGNFPNFPEYPNTRIRSIFECVSAVKILKSIFVYKKKEKSEFCQWEKIKIFWIFFGKNCIFLQKNIKIFAKKMQKHQENHWILSALKNPIRVPECTSRNP